MYTSQKTQWTTHPAKQDETKQRNIKSSTFWTNLKGDLKAEKKKKCLKLKGRKFQSLCSWEEKEQNPWEWYWSGLDDDDNYPQKNWENQVESSEREM